MEYNKLVSVSGLGGLYELVSSKADGGVVKSLEDGSSKFVSTRIHNFSHLESIEVYTNTDNVNLLDIFVAMDKSKEKLPEVKDAKAIKVYFEKVYASMDFERVYASDMKKMVKWFSLLKENKIAFELPKEAVSEAQETVVNENAEKVVSDKKVEKKTATAKPSTAKAAVVKNAPAKKINSPRKMA